MFENPGVIKMDNPQHHWLVAGQIVVKYKDGEQKETNMNALILTQRKAFTKQDIGKAQQALQLRFYKEVPQDPDTEVIDVFMVSVSYLGLMSQKDFHDGFSASSASGEPKKSSRKGSIQ